MTLGEVQALVNATLPTGATCNTVEPFGSWSGVVLLNEYSSSAALYKECVAPDGAVRSTGGITGGKICTAVECGLSVGSVYPAGGMTCTAGDCSAGSQVCYQGCQLEVQGFGLTVSGGTAVTSDITAVVTSPTCSTSNYVTGITTDDNCEVINGVEWCDAPNSAYACMRVDGQLICNEGAIGESGICSTSSCSTVGDPVVELDNGGEVAPSETPSPPAPDNGTPGVPAPPDGQFTSTDGSGGGQSWNYWSPGTVGNSSTGSGGDGGGGDGDTGQKSCGEAGEAPCGVEIVGDFNAPPIDDTVPGFGEALADFQSRIAASAIGQALTNIAASVPEGGAPPTASFTLDALGGETFTYAAPQEVIDAVVPVLQVVMLLVWALVALMLFFKA